MFTTGVTLLSPSGGAAPASATWNPLDKNAIVNLSNGNLTATGTTSAAGTVRATVGKTTGSFYHEIVVVSPSTSTANHSAGVANGGLSLAAAVGSTATSIGFIISGAVIRGNSNLGNFLGALANGDVIGVAVNIAIGRIWFRKNGGAWSNSGNPVAGTGGHTFTVSGTIYPAVSCTVNVAQAWTARFSSGSWGTAAPSGFLEWA